MGKLMGTPRHPGSRSWLIATTWALLFVVVLVAPSWLATTALISALVWITTRQWLRARRARLGH
jgi:hypothetical protein